jgi:hypothetical protein
MRNTTKTADQKSLESLKKIDRTNMTEDQKAIHELMVWFYGATDAKRKQLGKEFVLMRQGQL